MVKTDEKLNIDKEIYKSVVYRPNYKGEFPSNFMKRFIPSNISLGNGWYVGYSPFILDGFNMFEINLSILEGLQFFNIDNHSFEKYDRYNNMNENLEKKEILLTEDELKKQLSSIKYILLLHIDYIYNIKMKDLYGSYGKESDTWGLQLEEANKYLNDKNNEVKFLKAIAMERRISLDELASNIINNADNFNCCNDHVFICKPVKVPIPRAFRVFNISISYQSKIE